MRIRLYSLVLVLATIWLATSFVPPGMVVCAQSTGVVETGLTCPCQACQSGCADDALAEQAGCCGQAMPVAGIGQRCCTCVKLPPMLIAVLKKTDGPRVVPAAVAGVSSLALMPQRQTWRASINLMHANPPPLLKRSVVLLI